MEIVVDFVGGKRVNAHAGEFTIATDQSPEHGGAGSAPEPFTLFQASLATCAGLYVLAFCQSRQLPVDGIYLVQRTASDDRGRLTQVLLEVHVPSTFPDRYRQAIAHAAAACKVKKTLDAPPAFDVTAVIDQADATIH